jgi:hypothetical protein
MDLYCRNQESNRPSQPNLYNNCSDIGMCTESYKNETNSDEWCDLKSQDIIEKNA